MRRPARLQRVDPALHYHLSGRGQRLEQAALERISNWIDQHPEAWLCFSGGKDSTAVLHLALQVNPDIQIVWYDSGLEYPQTRTYIDELAARWNLNLAVIPAVPDALTILEHCGHWEHGRVKVPQDLLSTALIDEPAAKAVETYGPWAIYGLRADESEGRRIVLRKSKGVVSRRNARGDFDSAHLAPIWDWSCTDVYAYLAHHDVPLNPVYAGLARLGVPEQRRRVGMLVSGWGLDQGGWSNAMRIAPDLCRVVETRLPLLAQFR